MRWPFGRAPDREAEAPASPLATAVREALTDVQAYANSHGGWLELVAVTEEADVKIRMGGACATCPLSGVTLRLGVEKLLRERVPEARRVIQVR